MSGSTPPSATSPPRWPPLGATGTTGTTDQLRAMAVVLMASPATRTASLHLDLVDYTAA